MKTSMQNYKKRLVVLNAMLLVVVLLAGVSYAVFTGYSSQTDTNTLAATCMDLQFSGTNEINLTNSYPIIESNGLEQTPYTFTIKNNCDNYIEYYVIASVINTSTSVDSKYIKVSLLGDNDMNPAVITSLRQISTPQSLSSYNIKENYVLKEGDGITKNESRSFDFRMWLDGENETSWTSEDLENKTYQVKISVVGTVKTQPKDDLFIATTIDGKASSTFPTSKSYSAKVSCSQGDKTVSVGASVKWVNSKWTLGVTNLTSGSVTCNVRFSSSQSLADAVLSDNNVVSAGTIPGMEASSSNEAVLAEGEDDYGTTYYFRGAVEKNYVEFANKCWRIVRVTGEGSVKLVLFNDNINNETNPCSSTSDSVGAFAHYEDSEVAIPFNSTSDDIGFMIGANIENAEKSTILEALEQWYEKNEFDYYNEYLSDVVWCGDKRSLIDSSYEPFGSNIVYYAAAWRLISASNDPGGPGWNNEEGPSFKCYDGRSDSFSESMSSSYTVNENYYGNADLVYKIGLLTADEVAFAGAVYSEGDDLDFYLVDNTDGNPWWTMSPLMYESNNAKNFLVYNGSLYGENIGNVAGLRPSIALQSGATVHGTGRKEDPYVVE